MKAVSLFSGGLDSRLALRVIAEQGIEVIALHFVIPFGLKKEEPISKMFADTVSSNIKAELRIIKLDTDYLEMIKKPHHGYGKNLNPCIDCKIFMIKLAKDIMEKEGASFIVSGEVLGQRPMSQKRETLRLIENKAQAQGLILRPLSARVMDETLPEKNGWINREKLLSISGRGRREQLELAKKFKLKDFPWPGGGCLLTESIFCKRLKDLILKDMLFIENTDIIKVGRYFNISEKAFMIVGRDKEENDIISELIAPKDIIFEPSVLPGPLAVLRGNVTDTEITLAASIVARYTKSTENTVDIKVSADGISNNIFSHKLKEDIVKKYLP